MQFFPSNITSPGVGSSHDHPLPTTSESTHASSSLGPLLWKPQHCSSTCLPVTGNSAKLLHVVLARNFHSLCQASVCAILEYHKHIVPHHSRTPSGFSNGNSRPSTTWSSDRFTRVDAPLIWSSVNPDSVRRNRHVSPPASFGTYLTTRFRVGASCS